MLCDGSFLSAASCISPPVGQTAAGAVLVRIKINPCFHNKLIALISAAYVDGRRSLVFLGNEGSRRRGGQGDMVPKLMTVWRKAVRVAVVATQRFDTGND